MIFSRVCSVLGAASAAASCFTRITQNGWHETRGKIMLSRVYSRVTFNRRPRLAWPCSRYLQAAATQQALLEPLDSHPGISCLSLNRPLSKNAISTILLQVNQPASVISYRLVHIIVSYSNSEKALKSFIATRGKTTSISMDTTSDINHSVRVLILRSTTIGSFCAGADLFERRTMSQAQVAKFLDDLRDTLGKLESLPMPTIAAIDGPALGGGLELSLACDLRVASKSVFL